MQSSELESEAALSPALSADVRAAARIALPLAVVGLALTLRLRLAWENISDIVLKSTPDDAYYYFNIARNIAHGRNVTFDGETITNGFHPLWLAMITPVFVFVHGEAMPIHVILTMGAVLGTATALMVYLILMRLTSNVVAAAIGAGAFAVHPYTVSDAVNGVETAVTVFLLSLVVWMMVRMWDEPPAAQDDVALGAACGLIVLARTDTIFIVPLVAGVLLFRARKTGWTRRLLRMAIPCAAVIAPWIAWTLAANGTVVQVSGVAGAWGSRHNYL